MEKKTRKVISCLNLMVSEPYYLFHFLIFFSYFVLRNSASSSVLTPYINDRLLHREIQAFLAFAVITAVKIVKEETWEGYIADTLLFAKVFIAGLASIMDYYLAFWYLMAFLVMYILTEQPAFEELGTSIKLTPLQLESLLTEGTTSKLWLVQFRALCSSTCIRSSRFFPELAVAYSNKNLSLGIVDLGLFPNTAEKFGISISGSMSELPTYILFENAVEVARIPDFTAKSSYTTITKGILCRHFELDRHHLEYLNRK